MAMIEDTFTNIGICGSHESADGVGAISINGYRNFGQHPWPQMDIGEICFYNPESVTEDTKESDKRRRLTYSQAYWLAQMITSYTNTLIIPSDEEIKRIGRGRMNEPADIDVR